MEILRTPDDRFRDLPDWPYAPRWLELGPLRLHYIEEGPAAGPKVLLLHGEPSWSYLYRKMIPPLTAGGARVVAPDLIGFGRSDKPAAREDYSFQRHVDWMRAFVTALDLRDVWLMCQDWGGLIGLRLVADMPERFAGVVAANTFLPTGDEPQRDAFLAWLKLSQRPGELDIGRVVAGGCREPMPPDIRACYDAPFPDERYKAGARAFPTLVPIRPDDPASAANRAAWEVLRRFDRPFVTAFSDGDPITRGSDAVLQRRIPGAAGQPHTIIKGAGHFLQEDRGTELAAVILQALSRK